MTRVVKKKQIMYLLFFILMFILSMQSKKNGGDDTDFTQQILSEGRLNWLINRYMTWSGRIMADYFASVFLLKSKILWSLANSFFSCILVYSINKIAFRGESTKIITSIFILGYVSLGIFIDTTLWITGSFNYLWPIAIGMYSLILVSNAYHGVETKFTWFYIFCGAVASLGIEQMSFCLLAFSFLVNLKIAFDRGKLSKKIFIYFITIVLCVTIVLLCPGSAIRVVEDSKKWYPEFLKMTLFEKIGSGILWQFNYYSKYLLAPNLLLSISVLVSLIQAKSTKKIIILKKVLMIWLCVFSAIILLGFSNKLIFDNSQLLSNFAFFIYWIVFYILIYGLAIYISQDKIETFFIILASILSSSVMFFSPTIFASGPRSLGVSFIFLIIVIGKIIKDNQLLELEYFKLIYTLPIINLCILILWLIRHGFLPHAFL